MKYKPVFYGVMLLFILVGCTGNKSDLNSLFPESVIVTVKSTNPAAVTAVPVILDIARIKEKAPKFNPNAVIVTIDNEEIPAQLVDADGDGTDDRILCVTNLAAMGEQALSVRFAPEGKIKRDYIKRTQAEISHKVGGKFVDRKYQGGTFQNTDYLRVPPEHTDHSFYIRYEGPGWESDKVGYRFYLDWRNAVDIFGKKTSNMVLQNVGQDGFDSYHEMADWGMDVLKVGNSLGVGSIGTWFQEKANRVDKTDSISCAIVDNGPVFSKIRTVYYGWQVGDSQVDLTSELSIWAGSRLTHCELSLEGEIDNICTGVAKHDHTQLMKAVPQIADEWGYLARWGNQSLAGEDDLLGMAVLFKGAPFKQLTEDKLNHVVILNPQGNKLDYYFLAAWEQEPGGIQTRQAFETYLNQTVTNLSYPPEIIY